MPDPMLDFTGRDYTAELERLYALLGIELPAYTDRNHADPGIALLRLGASETDELNHYNDFAADQGFINYAQFKQYLIDLGRNVDYLPTLASGASTRLRLTRTTESGSVAISVPKYSAFGRADGLTYLTVEAVSIAANTQAVEVNAVQGTVVEATFEPVEIAIVDFSGCPRVALPRGVSAGFTEIWHGDPAVSWMDVDTFADSAATDRHFLLELNGDDDSVWIVLGDGVKGSLPPDQPIHVRYVRTDEATGNCGSGTIYLVPDTLSSLVTCTNIEPATGGAPAEDTESIRRAIPAMTSIQRRAVIDSDYEALVGHVAGVRHVQCVDRNTSPIWPHRYIGLYVVPEGGGPMSSYLKEQIWAACCAKGHLGPWPTRYILKDAIEDPIDFTIRLEIVTGYDPGLALAELGQTISTYLDSLGIGGTFSSGELSRLCNRVPGLAWIQIIAPTQDYPGQAGHVFVTGAVSITRG